MATDVVWYEAPGWTKHIIDDDLGGAYGIFIANMDNDSDLDIVATGLWAGDVVWYENIVVGIEPEQAPMPKKIQFNQNYPNPFNSSTVISYSLPFSANVTIDIYDILGRHVESLLNVQQTMGNHQVIWEADDFSSGVYFYKLQAGDYTETKKMVLLK